MQQKTTPDPKSLRITIEQQLEQNNKSIALTNSQNLDIKTPLNTQLKLPALKLFK